MSEAGENLLRNKEQSETKSYLVGLERGKVWAEDYADYFTMREFSELDIEELVHFSLPQDEDRHFRILSTESPMELRAYIRGWLAGVRESTKRY